MASMLISDPTLAHFKLMLWREASDLSERVTAGDIVMLSSRSSGCCGNRMVDLYYVDVRVKKWREEIVGHSVMLSKMLNLHQLKRMPLKGNLPFSLL